MNPAAADALMAIFGYERVDEVGRIEKVEKWIREHWKLGDDFHCYRFNWNGPRDCLVVTGANVPLIKQGQRKGKPNYRKKKNTQTFYIPIDTYNQIVGV